jgi:hypothetical protein
MNKYLKLTGMWFDGAYCCEIYNPLTESYSIKRFMGYSKKAVLHELVHKYNVIVSAKWYNKQKEYSKQDLEKFPLPLKIILSMNR